MELSGTGSIRRMTTEELITEEMEAVRLFEIIKRLRPNEFERYLLVEEIAHPEHKGYLEVGQINPHVVRPASLLGPLKDGRPFGDGEGYPPYPVEGQLEVLKQHGHWFIPNKDKVTEQEQVVNWQFEAHLVDNFPDLSPHPNRR